MTETRITWDKETETKFQQILEKIPALVRDIAEIRITKKIDGILREQNRRVITEKDMVDALFAETPPGFVPLMKTGVKEVGIDFEKYGYK